MSLPCISNVLRKWSISNLSLCSCLTIAYFFVKSEKSEPKLHINLLPMKETCISHCVSVIVYCQFNVYKCVNIFCFNFVSWIINFMSDYSVHITHLFVFIQKKFHDASKIFKLNASSYFQVVFKSF